MNAIALRERLISSGLADADSICGCSPEEILLIESAARRPLPIAYAKIMMTFGKSSGRFLRDLEIHFPSVLGLEAVAVDILQDAPELQISMPSECFVFAVRNKEQFLCFCETGDDPPIESYMSGNKAMSTVAKTFTDFILAELELSEYQYAQVKGTPYDLFRVGGTPAEAPQPE